MGPNGWRRARLICLAILSSLFYVNMARASNLRWGFSAGYGGEGVTANVNNSGTTQSASRSEGPLILGVFVEKLVSDSFVFGIEHVRGVSLLPATSEEWFMGISMRWYFGQAPSLGVAPPNGSTLLIKRYVPFLGFSTGFASANIERQGEAVGNVSGSGVYLGFRVGYDFVTGPGQGLRPELITSTTDLSSSFANPSATTPASLLMYALQCSWYFDF